MAPTTVKGQEAFRTHHNYIRSLRSLIENVRLSHNNISRIRQAPLPLLETKTNLITLTAKSLADEVRIVKQDQAYSYASTSWLPVKAYYLLFNMMLTIHYLYQPQESAFKLSHSKCSAAFTEWLAKGQIRFDRDTLNTVYDGSIFSHSERSGANLRSPSSVDQYGVLAIKQIALYKLDEWKRNNRIADFRSSKHRLAKENYLNTFQVSIFEFPYYMRLRANYRDFAFINGVSASDTADYFMDYIGFAKHLYRALKSLRDKLISARSK